MALQCQMSLNATAYQAGQSPSPMATLQVYNPNAVAVAVTGITLSVFNSANSPINAATNLATPAMGPGQVVVAPALSSITFGPFPVALGNAGALSAPSPPSYNSSPEGSNPQVAQPLQQQFFIGATVLGSDSSVNEAGRVALTLYSPVNLPASLGGVLNLASGQNLLTGLVLGVL
jgi:hypothetical protein